MTSFLLFYKIYQKNAKNTEKITKKHLTLETPRGIIGRHVKLCVEVECGYTPFETGDGGNFYGVCYG